LALYLSRPFGAHQIVEVLVVLCSPISERGDGYTAIDSKRSLIRLHNTIATVVIGEHDDFVAGISVQNPFRYREQVRLAERHDHCVLGRIVC
jgi:hypothetical protein